MPKTLAPLLLFPTRQAPFVTVAMAIAILVSWLAFSVKVLVLVVIAESVYVGADLFAKYALYLRSRQDGEFSHITRHFNDEQLKLIYQRKRFWGHRLFGSILEREFDKRKHIRNKVEYMKGGKICEFVSPKDFPDWVTTRIQEMMNLSDNAMTVLRDTLNLSSDGLEDTFEKIEDIVISANHLVEIWEDVADWMIRCRSIVVDSTMKFLPDLFSNVASNTYEELLGFGYNMVPHLDQGLRNAEQAQSDEVQVITYKMTLTADAEQFMQEVEKYMAQYMA